MNVLYICMHLWNGGYPFLLPVLSTFTLSICLKADTNPWLCSYTGWISCVHQHICRNRFVSDSTGSHKENQLEDYMEHKAIKRKIIFPHDGRRAHDIEQSSEPEFKHYLKASLGATPVENKCQQQRVHAYYNFHVTQECSGDIRDLSAGPGKNIFKANFSLLTNGEFQSFAYPYYTNIFLPHSFI